MITHLRIQNIALIDEAEVDFAHGLNILSGETGAGKSIVIDSIGFLLGGRVSRDIIRAGADFAMVEGIMEFTSPFLEYVKEGLFALGIDFEDEQIMLSRTMQADNGKSVCRINGRTVTVGVLKNAAELLVDLHGQHEHQSLLDPLKQLQMLDQFCGEELFSRKAILEGLLHKYKSNNKALKAISGNQRAEQIEIWKFQLDEIEKAALKHGEEELLTAKRDRLAAAEKLSKNTTAVIGLLYSGFYENRPAQLSAVDQVAKAAALSAEIARLDPSQEKLHASLLDIQAQLSEITRDFRAYSDELDADPSELDKVEARLDIIYRLKKKYGATVEIILKKQEELAANLDGIENSEAEIKRLQAIRKTITKEITTVCNEMNKIREEKSIILSTEITKILQELGMESAKFSMQITRKTSFGSDGNDLVEFIISPNPGEPHKPLRKIASGGEMSRIMLAIKTIMTDRIPTVIFDEVDTGVSGRTAQKVAENLSRASRTRQILCITHLPQIAAMADTHFQIQKSTQNQRTVTKVIPLNNDESINELSRLTAGAQITEATLNAAKEMKLQANEIKNRR